MIRPMLSDCCLSCLSVTLVGVLWKNGWMDQDETWHAGRPRPWPHCVRWGTQLPSPKGAQPPNFRPISVVAIWLDGSRCQADLSPSDIVLDRDPAAPPQKGGRAPPIFGPCLLWPNGWIDQDATWYGGRPRPGHIVLDGDPFPPPKKGAPIFGPCLLWPNGLMDQGTTCYVDRPRPRPHCVRWGPAPPKKGAQPPIFGRCLLWPNGHPSQLLLSTC